MILNKKDARRAIIYYHHLTEQNRIKSMDGLKAYLEKIRSIQVDPLRIIAPNAELTLASRVNKFTPKMLDDLLYKERFLLEGWDKCFCAYVKEDFPYFSRFRTKHFLKAEKTKEEHPDYYDYMISELKANESISSKDVENTKKVGWYWSSTSIGRAFLEAMFYGGEVLIHHREGQRKYFSLTGKLIDDNLAKMPDPNQDQHDYYKWHVLRRINNVGFIWDRASDAFMSIDGLKTKERKLILEELSQEGKIFKFAIEGLEENFYGAMALKKILSNPDLGKKWHKVSFIAPLDPFMWDRKMINAIFDFDYTWEVYKPKDKREYGYYVLPMLYGDKFAGRIELVNNRKEKILEVKNVWYEDGFKKSKQFQVSYERELKRYLAFATGTKVSFSEVLDPEKIKK